MTKSATRIAASWLAFVATAFALAGCAALGESPAADPEPNARGRAREPATAAPGDPDRPSSYVPATDPSPAPRSEPPCMLDPSDGRMKRCVHVTASGTCAHYAQWCDGGDVRPQSGKPPCLFDPSDGRTKECHHVTTDGKCAHFGAWCNGSSLGSDPCMFDDGEKRYRTCHHVTTDGKCAHYGTACTP